MTNLAGKTITQVAAGDSYSLLLASDGTVFSFGSNSSGKTGLNTTSGNTLIATPIDTTNLAGKTITQVATGGGRAQLGAAVPGEHSLLLASDGTVFSFGDNYYGQTGLNTTNGNTPIATPINTTNLTGKTITQIAAGGNYSLLLASDGTVFSFGSNEYGQTGLNTASGNTLIATPINTANLADKTITQIAAGGDHSLLLASDGTVFSFGLNGWEYPFWTYIGGQTGLNSDWGNTLIATPIVTTNLAGKTITQIAAGDDHSLLLASDGTVFSFGSNFLVSQTGHNSNGGNITIATPIVATNLAGKTITQIAAGSYHSLLLADDGTVFSFGANYEGRTGLGTTAGNTLIATPIITTNLAGKAVTQTVAGGGHNLLLTVPVEDGLPGDFNTDGKVDAADYVVWRKGLDTLYTPDDYDDWRANFGATAPGAGTVAGQAAAVPEPAAIILLAALLPFAAGRRLRRNFEPKSPASPARFSRPEMDWLDSPAVSAGTDPHKLT